MSYTIALIFMGFSGAATDSAVAAVFFILWRLDRQKHLLAFALAFGFLPMTLIASSLGQWTGHSSIAEPFADFFYIASMANLAGGCLALTGHVGYWGRLIGITLGFFLCVEIVAAFGIPGVNYVPVIGGLLCVWLTYLFLRRQEQPANRLLAIVFAARATTNLSWPLFHFTNLGGFNQIADQVVVIAIALTLIVTDLTSARRRAESASAELCAQTKALTALNAQLVEERTQADAANRAKSQFLANVSHELRTPLNAVIGFSEILANGQLGASEQKSTEYGRLIHAAGQHLLGVINDVLDMSRIEAGKTTVTCRPMDLSAAVKSVLSLTGHQAEARGVVFTSEIAGDAAKIDGDEQLIKQVLINILSNAFKYTERGGSVLLKAIALPEDRIEITVSDTGIGIESKELPYVFEPFVFSGSALTRRRGGIGLGLSITKRLVELHGGAISIASTPGKGTTVAIVLPRHHRPATEAATETAPESVKKSAA